MQRTSSLLGTHGDDVCLFKTIVTTSRKLSAYIIVRWHHGTLHHGSFPSPEARMKNNICHLGCLHCLTPLVQRIFSLSCCHVKSSNYFYGCVIIANNRVLVFHFKYCIKLCAYFVYSLHYIHNEFTVYFMCAILSSAYFFCRCHCLMSGAGAQSGYPGRFSSCPFFTCLEKTNCIIKEYNLMACVARE